MEHAGLAGRGVLAGTGGGGALVESSRNISIGARHRAQPERLRRPARRGHRVTIKGLGSFSSKGWGDGIDVFCSSNVAHRRRLHAQLRRLHRHLHPPLGVLRRHPNITVRNSTLWADVAHPINVGTHGNTDNPEVLENLTFKNLDILDHREPQMNYQGCIALNPGDSNLIKNVRIEDVRVEDFRWGQVIYMRVMYNTKYNTSVGRGIENVYVKNLSYTGTNASPSLLLGYDAEHAIKDVTFENLVVNGTVIADSMKKPSWYYTTDTIPMYANEHVTNLRFLTTAEAEAAAAS